MKYDNKEHVQTCCNEHVQDTRTYAYHQNRIEVQDETICYGNRKKN